MLEFLAGPYILATKPTSEKSDNENCQEASNVGIILLVISLALSPLFHIHSSGELHGKAGSGHVVIMISVTFA